MTAAELIEQLGQFPPTSHVMFEDDARPIEVAQVILHARANGQVELELTG